MTVSRSRRFAASKKSRTLSARLGLVGSPVISRSLVAGLARGRRRRGEAVTAHHLHQGGEVRRTAGGGCYDIADLVEVGGAEHAGGGDREELRVAAAAVLKPVDRAAGHAHALAGSDLDRLAVDCPRRDAFEPVDRLLEGVVA